MGFTTFIGEPSDDPKGGKGNGSNNMNNPGANNGANTGNNGNNNNNNGNNGQPDPNDPNNNGNNGSGNNSNGSNSGQGQMPFMQSIAGSSYVSDSDDSDTPDFVINYNEKARKGDFDKALFRDQEILDMVATLGTLKHPNPLLTGDAGVGKTQLVEHLAVLIESRDLSIPTELHKKTIYEVPIASIAAGQSLFGAFEKRLMDLIKWASDPDNNVILFMDEIHQLYGDSINEKVAQILKPALASGDLHVIGATTTQEVRELLKDPAINRRFIRQNVRELTNKETEVILSKLKPKFEKHHNVIINDDILGDVVKIANTYNVSSHRPDTAITLLDRTSAYVRAERARALQQIGQPQTKAITLTKNDLETTAKNIVNAPINNPYEDPYDNMRKHIIDQDEAVKAVSTSIRRRQLNLKPSTKPNSFLFAGPTGTGKTQLAKETAKYLFGEDATPIIFDGTHYSESISMTRILGSSDGYVGSTSKHERPLDKLKTDPYSVIVIDEFEKGCQEFQNLWMSALEEGHIDTNYHEGVDFSKATIFATTNAGVSTAAIGFNNQSKSAADRLSKELKPEHVNRFGSVVMFNSISLDAYKDILKIKYNAYVEQAYQNQTAIEIKPRRIDLSENYHFIDDIAEKTYDPARNGRPAENAIADAIELEILDNGAFDKTNDSY